MFRFLMRRFAFQSLILAQTIENVLFCSSATDYSDQLFYTSRDFYNNRWLCHMIIVTEFSVCIFFIFYQYKIKIILLKLTFKINNNDFK